MVSQNTSELISNRIHIFQKTYRTLQKKSEDYIFSAVAAEAIFYQNPALHFSEEIINDIVSDGKNDGGIDIILIDPNSEEAPNLVLGQGKLHSSIAKDDIYNSINKMYIAFKNLEEGRFQNFNDKIQRSFTTLYPEIGDESKVIFTFYTSAQQKGIKRKQIIENIKRNIFDSDKYEIKIYFCSDLEEEIKELISRKDYVESGKINIDDPDNYLEYDEAIIVNASAFSLKELYAKHGKNLLSKNLRYHITGAAVDKEIKNTIENDPSMFWFKNNGITLICEDFDIDGLHVKLKNFSIINGAQTTYMIHRSKFISQDNDIYLPCKIIKANKNTKEENEDFIFKIAIASNSQKPIKKIDLKANTPEQRLFKDALYEQGIYYQTKRGEKIPRQFNTCYLNTNLGEIGKLYLAAIFQLPGTSRSKPSTLYVDNYYDKIFNDTQTRYRIAKIFKELLYINYYYANKFLNEFESENKDKPILEHTLSFAKNARTLCIAFVMLASRHYYGSISSLDLKQLFDSLENNEESISIRAYNIFTKNISSINSILPEKLFLDKDAYDTILYDLFKCIIHWGAKSYMTELKYDKSINATNYLKKDRNYYTIISFNWNDLESQIEKIFSQAENHWLDDARRKNSPPGGVITRATLHYAGCNKITKAGFSSRLFQLRKGGAEAPP